MPAQSGGLKRNEIGQCGICLSRELCIRAFAHTHMKVRTSGLIPFCRITVQMHTSNLTKCTVSMSGQQSKTKSVQPIYICICCHLRLFVLFIPNNVFVFCIRILGITMLMWKCHQNSFSLLLATNWPHC